MGRSRNRLTASRLRPPAYDRETMPDEMAVALEKAKLRDAYMKDAYMKMAWNGQSGSER